MTKNKIKKLDTIWKEIKKNDKKLEKIQCKIDKLYIKSEKILDKCDHKFPNGKNAIEGGFIYSRCKICSEIF